MHATSSTPGPRHFRQSVERLPTLLIRPTVARQLFVTLTDEPDPTLAGLVPSPPILPAATVTDPGWMLATARLAPDVPIDPALVLIEHGWWIAETISPAGLEALTRLWRHSVAVSFAARGLAREANDVDPEQVARAALLHQLGLWAVAAVDSDRLAAWLAADPRGRSQLESAWFGTDLAAFGRRLAEQWGLDPLVADAVWLHADRGGLLNACASTPERLGLIQEAYNQARRTPWALDPIPTRDLGPTDPRIRILTAEVQSRCGSAFIDPDASSREEWLTRDNVRLRRDLARTAATAASASRLVASLALSSPVESPQTWADRAALAWRGEPSVASACVNWREVEDQATIDADPSHPSTPTRPPSLTIALGDPAAPVADLLIWNHSPTANVPPDSAILAGWNGWARLLAERERVGRLIDRVVGGHRDRVARDEANRRQTLLAALAEFAAGAGHEINNPLAVIMGRAQLLLARSGDAETTRSLRVIITQAQRAHRILRDLMFVARPPESRPRACQPDEIVRASLRDLQHEAEAQGVRLVLEPRDSPAKVWADPEPLRQIADILTRNALEASPTGSTVRFATGGDARQLRWLVHDAGKGISPTEGTHLFDPFFCGRAAGRGLGLGLARAARIIDGAGGDIRWHSTPGQGSTFQVVLPLDEIPAPVSPTRGETT